MKKALSVLFLCANVLAFHACSTTSDTPDAPIPTTALTVSPTIADLTVGDTLRLTATITPENATHSSISWTSSNPEVATVSEEGLITGVRRGSATIVAQLDELSESCEIHIWNTTDHHLESAFFEVSYWGDYYGNETDNFTVYLGTAQHEGIYITGPGEMILLSLVTPKFESYLDATIVPGIYTYDVDFSLSEMTITGRQESLRILYEEDANGDGYLEETTNVLWDAYTLIRQEEDGNYTLKAELYLDNGESMMITYSGAALFNNQYEALVPKIINDDQDFECGFGEAFYMEDGFYKLDLMQGSSPYEDGSWMNRHRVNLFLHTTDDPDRITPGTYPISASPIEEGYVESGGYQITAGSCSTWGSYYFWMDQQTWEATYGFLQEGTLTISYEGDAEETMRIELEATDINNHRIHLIYKGSPILTEAV